MPEQCLLKCWLGPNLCLAKIKEELHPKLKMSMFYVFSQNCRNFFEKQYNILKQKGHFTGKSMQIGIIEGAKTLICNHKAHFDL